MDRETVNETAKKLQTGDILMRFDGTQIACDGTVPFRSGSHQDGNPSKS